MQKPFYGGSQAANLLPHRQKETPASALIHALTCSSQRRGSTSTGTIVWSVLNASPIVCPTKSPPVSTAAKQPNPRVTPAAMRVELVSSSLRCLVLEAIWVVAMNLLWLKSQVGFNFAPNHSRFLVGLWAVPVDSTCSIPSACFWSLLTMARLSIRP